MPRAVRAGAVDVDDQAVVAGVPARADVIDVATASRGAVLVERAPGDPAVRTCGRRSGADHPQRGEHRHRENEKPDGDAVHGWPPGRCRADIALQRSGSADTPIKAIGMICLLLTTNGVLAG